MRPKILCPECGSELQWGDRFCPNCGKPIDWQSSSEQSSTSHQAAGLQRSESQAARTERECKHCGAENPADSSFCKTCGADLRTGEKAAGSREAKQVARKDSAKKGSQASKKESDSGPSISWKTVVGFAAFLVVGVFVLELLTEKKPEVATHIHDDAEQTSSANMQVLPQIEALEKAVVANPNDTKSILELANLLHDNRFYDRAIAYYQKYLEKNPKDSNARVDLGICYFDLGKLEEAEQHMKRALKDDPKHVLAHFNLGIVNLRAGKMKEANEWFKKTIALAPNSQAAEQAKQYIEQHSTL
jgi:tetratricopeptide (TPR) repeat protein